MEKQRHFVATDPRSFHLAALSRQNNSNLGRNLGGLDSIDGDHLFAPARAPISDVRTRAFILGLASHLHDESFRGKNFSRRADRTGSCERKLNRGLSGYSGVKISWNAI